jgi:hypothetical protein
MKITLLISRNYPACERARTALNNLKINGRKLYFDITYIEDVSANVITIVPALFINDKLFSYGDVDTKKLNEYIAGI